MFEVRAFPSKKLVHTFEKKTLSREDINSIFAGYNKTFVHFGQVKQYDHKLRIQPYAISFFAKDGKEYYIVGTVPRTAPEFEPRSLTHHKKYVDNYDTTLRAFYALTKI